jgi:DnaK suppressor protein
MELATQTHLTKLRDLLAFRQKELRAEIHAAALARGEAAGGESHEVGDRKDEAARHSLSDVDAAQDQRDLDELAQVEAALHRLDAATYGDCPDCGEPIQLQRLLVQPAALRCAPCQAAHEHASGSPHAARPG